MGPIGRRRVLAGVSASMLTACRTSSPSNLPKARQAYPAFRRAHPTQLVRPAPTPARFDNDALDARFTAATWPGPLGPMRGWISIPQGTGPWPGMLWLHGDFAVKTEPFDLLGNAFPPADHVLFVPAWRGENGNPGALELLAGELDDAVAALQWFATRPDVDADQIFATGHSVGGALAALLALLPNLPLRETASIGGLYVPETFQRWSKTQHNGPLVRFDPNDPSEGRLRTLVGNVGDLQRPHHAYIGRDDRWFHPNAQRVQGEARHVGAPLTVEFVDGGHMSSLRPAYDRHMQRIRGDER